MMRRTSVGDLAVPAILAGGLGYLLIRQYYESLPTLRYGIAVPIAALALLEFAASRRVRAAVQHRPGARPMTALAIARCLALAKASSLVAALLIGLIAALLVRVVPDAGDVDAARNDMVAALVWLVASIGLVISALILERAAVDPGHNRRS